MNGTGVPLVTPFGEDGSLREDALREVATWLDDRVDFLVPCGSTGEAPLLTDEEMARVVETVAEAVDGPVLAGTGGESTEATLSRTERAAAAGADAALVVTPHYYGHDARRQAAYYRRVADGSPIPVYLYSVPKFTGVSLDPETVESLATHDGVAGIKDSSGDLGALQRTVRRTREEDFSVLVGAGSVYAPALDAGADGGILALANAVPELASRVGECHPADPAAARALNADLVELNHVLTARHSIPGVKAAVDHRGLPAGRPRAPFEPASRAVREEVGRLVDVALADHG